MSIHRLCTAEMSRRSTEFPFSDNGYAKWRLLQALIMCSSSLDELIWSTRLESVRKNVECFFGRLKIHFRILCSRIMFHKQSRVDNVSFTACIMHNMLVEDDGLDEGWHDEEEGEDDDLREGLEMRRIRLRLIDVRGVPNVPEGVRQIAQDDNGDDADIEDSHYTFRTQLIAHYN